MIKNEGKLQMQTLQAAIKDLDHTQKMQKQTATDELKAIKKQAAAAKYEHKMLQKFIAAKAAHEKALADLRATDDQVVSAKQRAQHTTSARACIHDQAH